MHSRDWGNRRKHGNDDALNSKHRILGMVNMVSWEGLDLRTVLGVKRRAQKGLLEEIHSPVPPPVSDCHGPLSVHNVGLGFSLKT